MTPCSVKALSTVKCTDGESALIEKYFAVVGCGGGGGGAVVSWCGGAGRYLHFPNLITES